MKQNSPFGAPMSGRTYDVQSDRSRKVVDTDNFTSSLNGWRILSSQTSVTLSSGRMRVTGTAIWATAQKVYVNIKEGAHYILKFKLDIGTANGFINVPVYNRPITALSPNWISTNKSGEYVYRFKAIDDTIRVLFELTPSNTPGSIIFVDDVTLEEEVPLKAGYRFGFNGQEKDDEVSGAGNTYTAEFWEYDSRLGRRFNVDPQTSSYSSLSPYATFNNNPIFYTDFLGLEGEPSFTKEEKRKMAKFERKAERLAKRIGKEGKDLFDEMESRHGGKSWMYVKTPESHNNATSVFTSVRDLVDYKNNPTYQKTEYAFTKLQTGDNNGIVDNNGNFVMSFDMSGSGAFQVNSTITSGSVQIDIYQGAQMYGQDNLIGQLNVSSKGSTEFNFNPSQGAYITIKADLSKMATPSMGTFGYSVATTIVPTVTTVYKQPPLGISLTDAGNNGKNRQNVYKQLKTARGF